MSDETAETAPGGEVDPRLLEILVCPLTKEPLVYARAEGELVSPAAALAFPIRDGIPIMLADEARELSDEEVEQYRKKRRQSSPE